MPRVSLACERPLEISIAGMGVIHAAVYAARRRVVPILITSTTTIAGLFSLAFGLGGKSLLWGPVAGAIVWGLAISTVLTLFVIPVLYITFMRRSGRDRRRPEETVAPVPGPPAGRAAYLTG